jgi:hypothetical protein
LSIIYLLIVVGISTSVFLYYEVREQEIVEFRAVSELNQVQIWTVLTASHCKVKAIFLQDERRENLSLYIFSVVRIFQKASYIHVCGEGITIH